MNRALHKSLTILLWLAPLVIVTRYWQLWDRLPARMATHFNAAGQANGWMTREMSLYYSLGFLVFMLLVFSGVLYLVQSKYELTRLSWALLMFFQVEIWSLTYKLNAGLNINQGAPAGVGPIVVITPVGVLVLVALAISEKRGTPLSADEVLAEEVHSGKRFGLILLLPLVALVGVVVGVPSMTARIATGAVTAIVMATLAMIWDGFHYRFSRDGVEIRTLGFRLKSIPAMQIKSYEIQPWSAIRGYGIRGIGNRKAYVWGNTGVRIEMYDGEVFLGHNDPQRIVHDLNVVKSQAP